MNYKGNDFYLNDDLVFETEPIESFISSVNAESDVEQAWREYVQKQKAEDLKELIESEHLKPEETAQFIENSFRDGQVRTT